MGKKGLIMIVIGVAVVILVTGGLVVAAGVGGKGCAKNGVRGQAAEETQMANCQGACGENATCNSDGTCEGSGNANCNSDGNANCMSGGNANCNGSGSGQGNGSRGQGMACPMR